MPRLHLELCIFFFFLCSIVLAQPSFGGRVHQINKEENAGVSADPSNPPHMNPIINSSHKLSPVKIHLPYPFPPDHRAQVCFAGYRTSARDSGYFGVIATMDVYGYDLKDSQMSGGSIWISNDEGQNLNQIVVGWFVIPSKYNDSQTHLSTSWTKDPSNGCDNLDCPGLQLVSGSPIFPGDIISPVTEGNGTRQTITIKVIKDKSSGDWWLHCGVNSDPIPIGYYPASLFDRLSIKASNIMLGGVARKSKTTGPPPMGTGTFAYDPDKAAVIRDIQLINEDGISTPIDDHIPAVVTDASNYTVSEIGGAKFLYGGPVPLAGRPGIAVEGDLGCRNIPKWI